MMAVDLLFWFWVGGTCLFSPEDCIDAFTFGSWIFYQPFSQIPFPWLTAPSNQALLNIGVFLTFVACHALLGAAIGWLVRGRKLNWPQTIVASFIILILTAVIFTNIEQREEIERETRTQLWSIYEIDETSVAFRKAEWIEDRTANLPYFIEEEGTINQTLENTDRTVIKVLCYSDKCQPDVPGEVYTTLSFDAFLAARRACLEAPINCSYYSLAITPMLFEVTINPQGILLMREIYLP